MYMHTVKYSAQVPMAKDTQASECISATGTIQNILQYTFNNPFSSPELQAHQMSLCSGVCNRRTSTIFKDLQNPLTNQSQILCGASMGSLFSASGSQDQDGHHGHTW